MSNLLTWITFLPLVGAVAVAALPKGRPQHAKWVAVAFAAVDLGLPAWLVAGFDRARGGAMQFAIDVPWVPQAAIRYHLGVDGISITMLALAALLGLLAIVGSWNVTDRPKTYFVMLLLLQVGMNGVFLALDFVLFYVFWELVLVPMFFLIGMWGGARREYASIKFFIYTLAGSVFMLVGILALYLAPNSGTFDMLALARLGQAGVFRDIEGWVFALFFLGFAVKVPIWPLHTWLPDAHVEAPTAASVLLAGILLKMGAYGFIRISLPMLPHAMLAWSPWIALLAVISIIYGAAVAFAQTDLKKLVAYSSVSHMGFVMLGIAAMNPEGLDGAVAVMFSHGVVTGMLFFMVGMVYERTHTRQIADLSGLSIETPVTGGMLAFASFASLGLPGLSGFVGEFLSLLGAWRASTGPVPLFWSGLVVIAAVGVLLAAAYMLWMVLRVVLGQPSEAVRSVTDASGREIGVLVPLIALTLIVGIWWGSLLGFVDPAVKALLAATGIA
jgi:NADH-quinone oxidoreductase subunit M